MEEPTLDVDSDHELLARHVAGDGEAFAELVRRHRDRLWAVALRTLGDREEAADAVQDALVSAFRAAHTFRGQSAVTTWLHRITVNACLDRARRTASRRTAPVDDMERLEQLLEPHESAAAPAERQDVHRELLAALATLPPTSGQLWSSSTCRATPWPRRRACSMYPSERSKADAPGDVPVLSPCSLICAVTPGVTVTPKGEGTGRRGHPSHRHRDRGIQDHMVLLL